MPPCSRTVRTGSRSKSSPSDPAPFLKWAGGKRQLLTEILGRVPAEIDTYYEPFVGGGAVFFALSARQAYRRAVIADQNRDLIDAYLGVRNHLEDLVQLLKQMPYQREFYYRERAKDPRELSPAERAARVIYLNRCCYNGLYRVNRSGQFNVPFGRYKNPTILDEPLLRAVSTCLKKVSIRSADFSTTVRRAGPKDFVYFDPPYYPVSDTANFTAYDNCPFGPNEQAKLGQTMRDLKARGVKALLSNSDVPETRRLYKALKTKKIHARRAINCRADRRGKILELLVSNY